MMVCDIVQAGCKKLIKKKARLVETSFKKVLQSRSKPKNKCKNYLKFYILTVSHIKTILSKMVLIKVSMDP